MMIPPNESDRYGETVDTKTMDPLWLDRTEYPFTSRYYAVNGYNLHYIDEGQGETILFVHGTPSWSFDVRNLIKPLRSAYRCVAVDHIGFGLSDKPYDYDYSTRNHSRTLADFIEQKQLREITLVVHDFGGPIGLNVAIQHPDRIKRLIILNSWLWSSQHDPVFIRMSRLVKSPLAAFLYRYLNVSPRFLLPASFGRHKLPGKLLKQYTKPFANRYQREGPLAFARSLVNDQAWFEQLWQARSAIMNKPTLFIWGLNDSFIGPDYLDKFSAGFPNSTCLRLEASGHFPQEEEPLQVTQAILEFMSATDTTTL